MTPPYLIAQYMVGMAWAGLGTVYLIGIPATNRTAQRQGSASRMVQLGLTLLAYFFLFAPPWYGGILAWTPVPQSRAAVCTGVLLTLAGCLLAIWARIALGRNWSLNVTVKREHTLITRGPYALVRHPIYSGLILAALGTAIVHDHVQGFVGLAVIFSAFWLKYHTEEGFMEREFGDQYAQYRRRVKALIPGVL
jgi:protein-S-isoprenylcysteine O-methyltransferase Ste14